MATNRVDHVVTRGIFSIDGEDFEVDNNIWIIGDDDACFVIDAAHVVDPIVEGVGDRQALMILCTHGHNDHIGAAGEVWDATHGPIWLHPDDQMLWDTVYPEVSADHELGDGQTFSVGPVDLLAIHTPGHSPGSTCLYAPALGVVFTGDTLFAGGPGATGRSYSDFGTIISSIRDRLLTLPPDTAVHTGHGDDTTIGAEAPHLDEWIVARTR